MSYRPKPRRFWLVPLPQPRFVDVGEFHYRMGDRLELQEFHGDSDSYGEYAVDSEPLGNHWGFDSETNEPEEG